MNSVLKSLVILSILTVFSSCNKEATLNEYKYSEKEFDVTCSQVNPKLLKEAVYSFEEDITNYLKSNGRKNLYQSYAQFVNFSLQGNYSYSDMVSEHTKKIFKILKEDQSLWIIGENTTSLNYNHGLIKCLSENIKDNDLKTTFNALLSTNSMSARLFVEPLRRKNNLAVTDKYLATYIALDMYYVNLFNVDLEAKKSVKQSNKISTIKPQPKSTVEKKVDPHEGHNH